MVFSINLYRYVYVNMLCILLLCIPIVVYILFSMLCICI